MRLPVVHITLNAMPMKSIQLTGHPRPVPINTIVWLEGEANYTRVHYEDETISLVTQPLHWFEQHLNFIRVHRSAIINPMYVQEFVHKKGRSGWVRLINNKVIPVARTRLELTAARLAPDEYSNLIQSDPSGLTLNAD
jgi:DNA-binding LytR/AlgR family response regulator